jgi:hypothetical protein
VRQDLNFWVELCQYVPRLSFQNADDVHKVQQMLIKCDKELMELDFSPLINYLDDVRKSFSQVQAPQSQKS